MGQVGLVGRVGNRLGSSLLLALVGAGTFVAAQSAPPAPPCVLTGRVTSGGTPLPGVSIVLLFALATSLLVALVDVIEKIPSPPVKGGSGRRAGVRQSTRIGSS